MGDTYQPHPAGSDAAGSDTAGADAAADLAEIQRRQEDVIKTALVPARYWWVIAAALVAVGAARDSHKAVVLFITIPLAVLAIAAVVLSRLPEVRRGVKVNRAARPGAAGGAMLTILILLAVIVTLALALSLTPHHVPHPLTISYAAGGAVLVIGGPPLNRYLRRLMLSRARQSMTGGPATGSPWTGVMQSDPVVQPAEPARSTNDGGAP
jgi:hypothetical protein